MKEVILDDQSEEALYIQIYKYFKEQIINGTLHQDEKLPSIRQLTMDIKVSKTTIESAYSQLVVEGYVNNIPKKGYFVVPLKDTYFPIEDNQTTYSEEEDTKTFINNGVDKYSFDIKLWKKLYGNVLLEESNALYTSGDEQGEVELRQNICEFTKKTRGVKSNPKQIIIGAGVQYLLGILCSLLKSDLKEVAIEYPGFNQAKSVFENYGMITKAIPVGKEGIKVDRLKMSGARLVYISPSHQYPTGSVMPISKRLELLNWAKDNDAIIIEDDYDCLIRYESRPIPALQGLDKADKVIYFGSFSKLLLPSIRVSYMILPEPILKKYLINKNNYSQSASKLEQLTLSRFMREGHFDKHIRKIKKIYYKKNEKIVNFINKYAKNKISILGHDSGLHMMFEIKTHKKTKEILEEAEKYHILLELVEGYNKSKLVMVFTYSGIKDSNIDNVLQNLLKIIN